MAKRKTYTSEQIILRLREAEVPLGQDRSIKVANRAIEVSGQTDYRWRKEYRGAENSALGYRTPAQVVITLNPSQFQVVGLT